MRVFAAALVFVLGLARSTLAEDAAELYVIGFSPDGRHFAFEQYGIQDGSGFPYSEIFVVDVAQNRWVQGSPIRVRLEDGEAEVDPARAAAHAQAQPALRRAGIVEGEIGRAVVTRPITDRGADPHRVVFAVNPYSPNEYELELTERDIASTGCEFSPDPTRIFTLTFTPPEGRSEVLQRDRSLPASRACPLAYRIEAVYLHPWNRATGLPAPHAVVVLINMFTFGFEGRDTRYLAVAARLRLN